MSDILSKNRIIFLTGGIDDDVANSVVEQMLQLEFENPHKDITLMINSQGGSVTSGFAIYDIMNYVKPDVRTICLGLAASMAAFLMAAGAKGKRMAFQNAQLMFHQPHLANPNQRQVSDIVIEARQAKKVKDRMIDILSYHTGQPEYVVEEVFDRNSFMTPEMAINFGAIDEII